MSVKNMPKYRIGTFNVGNNRYWSQFPGLREKLAEYHNYFVERLSEFGGEVVSAGLIDTVEKSRNAAVFLNSHDVDLIMCNVTTYATSSAILPVLKGTRAPIVLVGLQPSDRLDYATVGTRDQLENDNCTSIPEIGYVLKRSNIPYSVVFGRLYGDERVWRELEEWCRVARVLRALRYGNIGYLGHTYDGMLDMTFDPTDFHISFGLNIEMLEMCDLLERVESVTPEAQLLKETEIREFFHFPPPGSDPIAREVSDDVLKWSARVAAGVEMMLNDFRLDGLAYYYRGIPGKQYEKIIAGMIVGNSIFTGRGIPIAGEGDMKNCVAMLIMDRIGGGGSFAELHPVDFCDDLILIGHDGPGHIAISDEKPVLRGLSLYHGKQGFGASTEFKVKTGPITILSLTKTADGEFKFVCAEGQSLPGPIPATGNTNSRCKFSMDVASFVEKWSEQGVSHHFALGVGKQTSVIEKLAKALSIEMTVVCK